VYRTIFVYHVVNRQYLSEMSYPEKNTPSLAYVRPVRMGCLEWLTKNEGNNNIMMIVHYTSKKELKVAVGRPLKYTETSLFGEEYRETGKFFVARRPHLQGGGREFFAEVTMKDGLISAVR